MTTTTPNPQARLVTVVVEVDPEHVDETAPTGLTTAGHIELRDAIGQVGTVAHISRTARPVPAPPVVPVTNEKTRSYGRRRFAVDIALDISRQAVAAGFAPLDAAALLGAAKRIEEYLKGETSEAGA